MASYSNFNYFAGVAVVPKLLTVTNKYECSTRPACKDSSRGIWHLDTLMPYAHLWNKANKLITTDVIQTACNLYDVPVIAFTNIWTIAQFDWKMYPYVSHALKLAEKELILDAFDIVFRCRHGKIDFQQIEDFVIKLKTMKQEIRFFYMEFNK